MLEDPKAFNARIFRLLAKDMGLPEAAQQAAGAGAKAGEKKEAAEEETREEL